MDDFENRKVRRIRGGSDAAHDDNCLHSPEFMASTDPCPVCKGNGGTWVKNPAKPNTHCYQGCTTCSGKGRVPQ